MKLAPILISVYTRENHFKQCIESLSKCSLANQSILYIASDAGKTKKDQQIVDRIRDYVGKISGFKKVILVAQEKNIGSTKNIRAAKKIIWSEYDRLIFSEDDNIFSPNFLEFINKGLDKFEEDKSIYAINGYRHFYNIQFADNNYFMQNVDFSAWGYGIWKDRIDELQHYIKPSFFRFALLNPISLYRIWRHGNQKLFRAMIDAIHWNGKTSDNESSLYMAIKKKSVVMPTISKVRNIGWDGSGIHCKGSEHLKYLHSTQKYDNDTMFEYQGDGWAFFKENRRCFVKENYARMSFFQMLVNLYKLYKMHLHKKKQE